MCASPSAPLPASCFSAGSMHLGASAWGDPSRESECRQADAIVPTYEGQTAIERDCLSAESADQQPPLAVESVDEGNHHIIDVRPLICRTASAACRRSDELVTASGAGVELVGAAITLRPKVRGARELLGLDPLSMAHEGETSLRCAAGECRMRAGCDRAPAPRGGMSCSSAPSRPATLAWWSLACAWAVSASKRP
jgi:hypothetical protein